MPPRASLVLISVLGCFTVGQAATAPNDATTAHGTQAVAAVVPPFDAAGRPWTSRDSVAVRYFDPKTVEVSPDGMKFFVVSFHGDLSCDCVVYELTVFAVNNVRRALAQGASTKGLPPQPLQNLIRRTLPHAAREDSVAIWLPHWEHDSESISFQGPNEQGIPQLYQFNVGTGSVSALTSELFRAFSLWRGGDTIVSDVYVPTPTVAPIYPVHSITRTELEAAMWPGSHNERLTTFVSYRGQAAWELKSTNTLLGVGPYFSSNGRLGVALRLPKETPASWAAYDQLSGLSNYGGGEKKADFPQYVLIDAEHGSSKPVFDAPSGTATRVGREGQRYAYPQALWAEDNRHVILVNTALPLTQGREPERTRMAYIVAYDADSNEWSVIEPLESRDGPGGNLRRVTSVGWLSQGKQLLIRHMIDNEPAPGAVYTRRENRWISHSVAPTVDLPGPPKPPALSGGLSVTLREGVNEPPVWVASDGHHEIPLTSPDPALKGVRWAKSEPFQWREPSGKMITGGLLLPRQTQAGSPPLVIQAYAYEPKLFQPDGMFRHAYAAQSLVARGMAVLNVDIPSITTQSEEGTPRELAEYLERIDSAIDALASRGLIDSSRVGVIGFSRGGFNAYYAITHPGKYRLAAAVMDDSYTGTFDNYLYEKALFGGDGGSEKLYGGSFWQNKAVWLDRETIFNVDRVETPALFTIHDETAASLTVPEIGAFSLNHRPLEYLVFPGAMHALHAPSQRLASLEASTEWMSFWLQGETPGDPERASHWAELREQQRAVLDGAAKKGEEVAPLPDLHPPPAWAIAEWKATYAAAADEPASTASGPASVSP